MTGRAWIPIVIAAALASLAGAANAAESCSLCATKVVVNKSLAACFLGQYDELEKKPGGAFVVDLSDCEQERGVAEAIPDLEVSAPEPDTQFILSRPQLTCLKVKLEQPGVALDPSATIDLGQCP